MLRPRRIAVVISRMVGNVENSSGRRMNRVIIKIITDRVMEIASPMSTKNGGIGTSMNIKMIMMPAASAKSLRRRLLMADFVVIPENGAGGLAIELGYAVSGINERVIRKN